MLNTYYLNKRKIKRIIFVFFSLILSACGGSGGGNDESLNEQISEAVKVGAEPVEEVVLDMDSLVAAQDFSFTSKNRIQVSLELNDYENQPAYVSIYRKYQRLDSGRYYPDSTSRVIAGALQKGVFKQSFIGVNNKQKYLLEIWFYDARAPIQKELILNNDQLM